MYIKTFSLINLINVYHLNLWSEIQSMPLVIQTPVKDFSKERYKIYAKSCNSNLYTKYPSATYIGLLLGTMCCL